MDKHIEVIGIDHGWSNMKTADQIFTTGVKEISTEPAFYDNVVEWNGSYYKVGGKRLEVRDTKVENDNFYLLTLASVAKELKKRGMTDSCILLAVGLPLTRFGAEKQDFIKYLARDKEARFRFEKEQYHIRIVRVSVFPQCYAAVAECIRTLPERAVIVDIGSWTIDIMPLRQYYPDEPESSVTMPYCVSCIPSFLSKKYRTKNSCKTFSALPPVIYITVPNPVFSPVCAVVVLAVSPALRSA